MRIRPGISDFKPDLDVKLGRTKPKISGPQTKNHSAELKSPRNLARIRTELFDFEPELGLKLDRYKPKISGTVPTNRHTMIPNDSGPIAACFDDDPKLLSCEIAQPSCPQPAVAEM